jgi:hypothetical protein
MVTIGSSLVRYTCQQCGSQFFRKPSLIRGKGEAVFCSRKCSALYHRPPPSRKRILANKLREVHPDWTQSQIAREVATSRQLVSKWFRQGR